MANKKTAPAKKKSQRSARKGPAVIKRTQTSQHRSGQKDASKAVAVIHTSKKIDFQTMVEQNPAIVYTADLNQHIGVIYISPKINSLGFTQKEWLDDPELWLKQIHPDDRQRVLKDIEQLSKKGHPFHSEYRLRTKKGEIRWFLDEVVDVLDETGKPLIRQGFMLDITARKAAEEALSMREHYLLLLNDLTTEIIIAPDMNTLVDNLTNGIKELFGADDCYMTRWDDKARKTIPLGATAKTNQPYRSVNIPIDIPSMTSSVIAKGHALIAEDVFNSPYLSPEIAKLFPAKSLMGIPLLYGDNKMGAIIVAYNKPHKFEPGDLERAEQASRQIAIAIWSVEQELQLKKQLKEQETLARITTSLSQLERIGLANVLELIVHSARELIPGAQQAVIHLIDKKNEYLIPQAVSGLEPVGEGKGNLRVGEGVAGLVISSEESIYIPSIQTDQRFVHLNPGVKYNSLLVSPILSNNQKLGTISIQSEIAYAFTNSDINLLNELGLQAAIAIENTRLYDAIQEELKERKLAEIERENLLQAEHDQRLLAETSANATLALVSHTQTDKVLKEILIQVQKLLPGCSTNIALMENNKFRTAAWSGYEGRGEEVLPTITKELHLYPLDENAVMGLKPIIVPDTHENMNWVSIPGLEWIRSHISIPLIWNKELLGMLYIDDASPGKYHEGTIKRLMPLVNATTVALESSILIETTQKALNETSALYHITQGLVALNADELLNETVDLLKSNFNYYHVQVFVVDPENGNLVLKAASGEVGAQLVGQNHEVKAGTGIIGYAAETGVPFFTNDVEEVVFFAYDPYLPETKAEMAIPVRNDEKLYGILDIQQTASHPFSHRDQQLVIAVADQLSLALQKAELYEDLQIALEQEKAIRNQLIQNERLAVMGRLLASVSHELNNPLQAIQNALFLLKEEKGLSQQGMNDLEIVLAESERMAGLIERLRDTYRPPQAEEFQSIQLNAVIEDVYALLATHLRKNNIFFEFLPSSDLPAIMALSDQIRQVVINLMINGVDAMPDGGKLTVKTDYQRDAREIRLTFSDTGKGISPAILPYIFDPFVTNKKRGTGIGLTISREIVMKHNGRITAENNPETGATFKVWLPLESARVEIIG